MKRWLLVFAAGITLVACKSENPEAAILGKHDSYMDSSVAYQKAFKWMVLEKIGLKKKCLKQ